MSKSQFTIQDPQLASDRSLPMVIVATMLMLIGLVMVASTSASLDRSLFESPLLAAPFGRQAVFVLAGLFVLLLTSRAAAPLLGSPILRRRCAQALFILTLICLVAALLPGLADAHRGSNRWLRFAVGGMNIGFQPSELAKVAMVAMLASLLAFDVTDARNPSRIAVRFPKWAALFDGGADPRSLKHGFLPASVAIGLCVLLVGKEDFGTSVLLAGVGVAMLFVARCRLRHLAMLAGLGTGALAMLLFAAPYRIARIVAYKDFWSDPRGGGYQPLQSLTTIASGGWFGTGLGSGVQKYGYLPESHTDFIFAVICEEMGVFGAALVMALFCALMYLGLRTMLAAPSRFERLLAFGLTATLGLQAAMNIAVVTVVTPTTGISLPLVSAGGSGLLTFCLVTGLLAAMARRIHKGEGRNVETSKSRKVKTMENAIVSPF